MSHDESVVYMGAHQSNILESVSYDCDPATFKAGLVAYLKSDGTVSLTAADGSMIGVSLGRSLSDIKRTSFAVRGSKIPILLANGHTPDIGAQVEIDSTSGGKAVASGTAVNAMFRSEALTAYDEDGVEIADGAALIDMVGGL